MRKSLLPETGSVVIIEDEIEEVRPLLNILAKKGVAVTYYTGEGKDFPLQSSQRVRIIFLDLQTARSTDGHTLATMHVRNLQRLLGPDNGPYVLIIWSKKLNTYSQALRDEIIKPEHGVKPAFILELDKNKFFKSNPDHVARGQFISDVVQDVTGRFSEDDLSAIRKAIEINYDLAMPKVSVPKKGALASIERELKIKLKEVGAFNLFILWENAVNRAASRTVNDFASLCEYNQFWEGNLKNVFRRMAVAQAGTNFQKLGAKDALCSAMRTLNSSYMDCIETELGREDFSNQIDIREEQELFKKQISGQTYCLLKRGTAFHVSIDAVVSSAKPKPDDLVRVYNEPSKQAAIRNLLKEYRSIPPAINTSLLLDMTPSTGHQPGNVYEVRVKAAVKRRYLTTYFGDNFLVKTNGKYSADASKVQFLELEVSPPCDYAQNKWQKSRLISGVLFPIECSDKLKVPKDAYYFYRVMPNFKVKNQLYGMVFDYRRLKAEPKESSAHVNKKFLFRIKSEMLGDVLAKLANHINRPGIIFVE